MAYLVLYCLFPRRAWIFKLFLLIPVLMLLWSESVLYMIQFLKFIKTYFMAENMVKRWIFFQKICNLTLSVLTIIK